MPTTVQFRRGNTAQNNAFTGAAGELSINTSNSSIRVHDGSSAGGTELATLPGVYSGSSIGAGSITSSKIQSNVALQGVVTYLGGANEKANVQVAAVTSNITFSPYDQPVLYFASNTSSNTTITINFTGVSNLTSGNVLSATLLLTNNATYNAYISAVQVDGSAASYPGVGGTVDSGGSPTGNTLRWQTSAPTSGSANVEVYSFSIFKQAANSYIVLGSKSNFN